MNKEIKLWTDVLQVVINDTEEADKAEAACNLMNSLHLLDGELLCGVFTEEEGKKIINQTKIRIMQLINLK